MGNSLIRTFGYTNERTSGIIQFPVRNLILLTQQLICIISCVNSVYRPHKDASTTDIIIQRVQCTDLKKILKVFVEKYQSIYIFRL